MKVGTLAYAVNQGLGILAKAFVDNEIVTDVLVVEHYSRPRQLDWYPNAPVTGMSPIDMNLARDFVRDMDCMLFFETPFDWDLIPYCREQGVATVLMPMYECMPRSLPHQPDRFICPSLLDKDYYPTRSKFIPVPVDVGWRQRTTAHTFIHNAGNLGLRGRNGTLELLQAMQYVTSPLKLLVRAQCHSLTGVVSSVPGIEQDDRVTISVDTLPYEKLWAEGDVFVFPEKFNGLSLPIQEARAAGLLVMSTNRYPMNTWLPPEPLIPTAETRRTCVSGRCVEFDESVVTPQNIAATMDAWYGKNIEAYSLAGKYWAEEMAWETLKSQYQDYLASI